METTIGSFNERGLINNLYKKGFNVSSCLSELIGNCIDAHAKNCIFHQSENRLQMIDDGNGMDQTGLRNMFDLYRENHKDECTIGTCGLGAKASIAILCNKKDTAYIYTKSKNGLYLKCVFPVGQIFSTNKYLDLIKYYRMNESQVKMFIETRKKFNLSDEGTIIDIPLSDEIEGVLDINCTQKFTRDEKDFMQRFGLIYSKYPIQIKYYRTYDRQTVAKTVKPYLYFEDGAEYYRSGIFEYHIKVYKESDEHIRFICRDQDGKYIEIRKLGKNRFDTKPNVIKESDIPRNKFVGKFVVKIGQRKDPNYFDEKNPELPSKVISDLCLYDEQFFERDSDYFRILCKPTLVRNKQVISFFDVGQKVNSARGDPEQNHKIYLLRMEMSYETSSEQTNIMDDIICIQENKNQWTDNLPVSLVRLLKHLKENVHKIIWEHFEDLCQNKQQEEDDLFEISSSEEEEPIRKKVIDTPVAAQPLSVSAPVPLRTTVVSSEPISVPYPKPVTVSPVPVPAKTHYTKSEVLNMFSDAKIENENEKNKKYLTKLLCQIVGPRDHTFFANLISTISNVQVLGMIHKAWENTDDQTEVAPIAMFDGMTEPKSVSFIQKLLGY